MIDAGQLNEYIAICRPGEGEAWGQWPVSRKAWAKVEDSPKNTIFSSVGLSARTKLFTFRRPFALAGSVILWRGAWYYVTASEAVERAWCRVTAAETCPVNCVDIQERSFIGFLTEPYVRYDQPVAPYAVNTERRVLVTAKNVLLRPGQLVLVNDEPWPIKTAHLLDAVKNEYEIERRVEL